MKHWCLTIITFVAPLTAGVQTASAQTPRFTTMVEVIRDHEWADAVSNLLDIMAAMPDSDYTWKPAATMRSFGEIVGHITSVQFRFCDAVGGAPPQPRADWEKRPSPSQARQGLMASLDRCDAVMDNLSDADLLRNTAQGGIVGDAFVTMTGHTRRETGKLVSYLTARGHKAPSVLYQCGRRWRPASMRTTDVRGERCIPIDIRPR
jgi:uncharacterized damage-inducible protein DinB